MEVSCIVLTFNNIQELLGIVAYPFNPSILEADTGELLWVQGQSGLQRKTLSQKQNKEECLRAWAVFIFNIQFYFEKKINFLLLAGFYPNCLPEHSIHSWPFPAHSSSQVISSLFLQVP